MKRFRWSAALVALALMLSWASAAQAAPDETTSTSAPPTTTPPTTTTAPKPEEPRFCDPAEGVVSHTGISLDTASAHPSASASFTVKDGCRVIVFLVSLDENGIVDSAPPLPEEGQEPPSFGAGTHTLTVDLPTCAQFDVAFVAFPALEGQAPAANLKKMARAAASGDQQAPEPTVLDEVQGETTNCPTSTEAPTTTTGGGQLPFTGSSSSLPLLIVALIMVIGGAASVLAARIRGRRAQ